MDCLPDGGVDEFGRWRGAVEWWWGKVGWLGQLGHCGPDVYPV